MLALALTSATSVRGASGRPLPPHHGSTTYYVAPWGNDANSGTWEAPFRTLMRARYAVAPGDTIYLRGGVYDIENYMDISGTAEAPITIASYPGEWAIFDGTGREDVKFRISGAWLIFKNFEVRHSPQDGVLLTDGAHDNQLIHIVSHDNTFAGFEIENGAANNLLLNCDAYANFDAATNGEHADGFGVKFSVGPGNRLVGCRAWDNADDGFDLWEANASVTLERCWAYSNGFDRWGVGEDFAGDGDGFKLGPGQHLVTHCVAWSNARRGFDYNDTTDIQTLYNNTSYNNPVGFKFYNAAHVLRNNLSFMDGDLALGSEVDDTYNSWNNPPGVTVTADDFVSLDDTIARGPRPSNGDLPRSNFLHPRPNSSLVDAGIAVGEPWRGRAPDLGAFEAAPPRRRIPPPVHVFP